MVLACIPNYGEDPKLPYRTYTPLGLPVLPVRQAVIPKSLTASIPSPLVNSKLPELTHQHYALRSLRAGFLYVQYELHPRDEALKWHIYQIDEDSQVSIINHAAIVEDKDGLTKKPRGTLVQEPVPTPCAQAVYIEKPMLQKRVWLAFSDTLWSQETLDRMVSNGEDRDTRMQCFEPKLWVICQSYTGAVAATSDQISKVIEYSKRSQYTSLIGEHTGDISQVDGSYSLEYLSQCTSIDKVDLDSGVYELLTSGIRGAQLHQYGKSKAMEESLSKVPNAKHVPPVMIALDDNAGIAYELNGFCSEPVGYLEQYQKERELQLHAKNCIDGAKDMMRDHALRKLHIKGMGHQMTRETFDYVGGIDENLSYKNAEVIPYIDEDGVEKLHIIEERFLTSWKNRHAESELHAWSDYEDEIDKGGLNTFSQHYDDLLNQTQILINERTDDLVTWLTAKPFIDSLVEFDKTNLSDGNNCVDVIGCAMNGISASPAGQALIDKWVASGSVDDENLIWRAVGLNYQETMDNLQTALDKANANHSAYNTETALNIVTELENALDNIAKVSIKSMQLYHQAQRSQSLNTQRGGIEKLFTTLNQRLIKPFVAPGADAVSGLVMEATLMARSGIRWAGLKGHIKAGVEANKAAFQKEMADINAKFNDDAWKQNQKSKHIDAKKARFNELDDLLKQLDVESSDTTQRIKQTLRNTWLRELGADNAALRKQHTKLLRDVDIKGKVNDMAFVRFNALLLIFQGVAINNLWEAAEKEQDPEKAKQLRLSLAIIGMSTAATFLDTVGTLGSMYKAPGSKALFSTGIKVAGTKLIVAAGALATVVDLINADKSFVQGENALGSLYLIKAALNFGSTFTGMATLVGLANPFLQASSNKALRSVGTQAAKMLAKRTFLVACFWLGLAILAVEVLIVVLQDDELEDWLERSAFGPVSHGTGGRNPSKRGRPLYPRFKTVEEQQQAFEKAMSAVLNKV